MTAAIELRRLEKSFGEVSIIRNISLSVAQGERHALIGPNGAGKSTTFNLISGYMAPTSGNVLLRGEVISGLPPYQINRRLIIFSGVLAFKRLECDFATTSTSFNQRSRRLGLDHGFGPRTAFRRRQSACVAHAASRRTRTSCSSRFNLCADIKLNKQVSLLLHKKRLRFSWE